ncbi:unnamed protein product [Somion occarium]|uniref:Transcriptional regulatory protein n=1 Tax=Somion occarium TaxID=3059160 RepID=A0ABP1D883_9APHY
MQRYLRALPWRTPILQHKRLFTATPITLSGHNKWSKIKHQKGAADIKKANVYSKASQDIVVAARSGGSADPEVNMALAAAVKRAKSQGVPKENIENALKRAAGAKDKGDQHVVYEIMGPGSVAVMVECLTDNLNRTIRAIRTTLAHHGARLAPVGFLFERKGLVRIAVNGKDSLEPIIEAGLDGGADDFSESESSEEGQEIEFVCPPDALGNLTKQLSALPDVELFSSDLVYLPKEASEPPDEETADKISDLLDELEANEETLRVWSTLA